MELQIERFELLLLIAALVAIVAKRFRVPYTVGLVVTGVALSIVPFVDSINLTRELLFSALLPPLIFEAAMLLDWQVLRRELPLVIPMATLGLLLAAGVAVIGMHWFAGWPVVAAGIFGALIAATDPVSVIASFKENGVTGRLRILVESESLFNDGTAAVLFGVLVASAQGHESSWAGLAANVAWVIAGGLGIGAALALALLYIAGRTTDHLVEITLTTGAAYGAFMLAEHVHCSGVLATLAAGLVIGNRGPLGSMTSKGREAAEAFWEYISFIANSLIFLLIGLHEARRDFSAVWRDSLIGIVVVIAGRAIVVYPIAWAFSRTRLQLPMVYGHVLFWGGLRGALALALALGLPPDLPMREQIISVAFAVVAFSVIVQGSSMTPVLRKLGLMEKSA